MKKFNLIDWITNLTTRKWPWRLTLTAAFLLPVILVLPHARSLVVRNAVVTAYVAEYRAPIGGRVTAVNVVPGARASSQEPAVALFNDRADGSRVARLEIEAAGRAEQVNALRERVEDLRAVREMQQAQLGTYDLALASEATKMLEIARQEALAADADLAAATSNHERALSLREDGLVSAAEMERAEAQYKSAQARYAAAQLRQQRLEEQVEEVRQGVFQLDAPDGVHSNLQLAQSLSLALVDLERQLALDEAEWHATEAEYQEATREHLANTKAEIFLPDDATVWEVFTSPSVWVEEGSRLLAAVDCTELYVDIAMDDAVLELIEPGHKVRMRVFGSFEFTEATVTLVRGSNGLQGGPKLAAEISDRGSRKGRVLARLDESRLTGMDSQSCGIGRTSYAEFEDIGLFKIMFHPLFN